MPRNIPGATWDINNTDQGRPATNHAAQKNEQLLNCIQSIFNNDTHYNLYCTDIQHSNIKVINTEHLDSHANHNNM